MPEDGERLKTLSTSSSSSCSSIIAETVSPDMKCVYVETNLDTRLVVLVDEHGTMFDFKEKLCKDHQQCFPELGEIYISAVKVKRQRPLGLLLDYHLSDSLLLSMVFNGDSHSCWFVFVDSALRIVELPKAEKNSLNLEEIAATDSLLLEGCTKNQNPEVEDSETRVAQKRKVELSDGEKSRKKSKVDDLSHSAAAATTQLSPREKQDNAATGKEIEVGEKSLEDEVRVDNIESSGNLVSQTESHLDTTNSGLTTRPDTENKKKRRKKIPKYAINQSSAVTTPGGTIVNEIDGGVPANVDTTPQSLPISNLDNSSAVARQKENPLDTNSGLTATPDTEKKRSKDDVNESLATAAAPTTSRVIVNETGRVPANADYVDDSYESLPVPRGGIPFVEAAVIDMCDDGDINQSFDAAISTSRAISPAEEDTLVAAHNAEPIKAADGEEPDKVLGSLKAKKETTEEKLEKTGKKSKKKHSLKVAKSQVLSVEVNSTALEETSPINNINDSFPTPAKEDIETDMGDNFGCSQNQDQVGSGGVTSIKGTNGLDLHSSASTSVSLGSLRKTRVQQSACSGTHRVQSR